MKIIKTTVYRLEMERDCGCRAAREYEDARYQKPCAEGTTTLCEKHSNKSEDAQEILREMILDTLSMQAEQAGKQYAPMRHVEVGDNGGVSAVGAESVQAMGVSNLPNRPRRDPLSISHVQVDRPNSYRSPVTKTASLDPSDLNVLNVAGVDGVEISTEIGVEVAEDPNLSAYLEDTLGGLGGMLDQDDAKSQGVPQKYLQDEQ